MAEDDQLPAGTVIGLRYRVEGTLGQGGFGTTYRAVDEESGEQVAVKALDLSRVADWKAVELFEREAKTLRQLDHPNIPDYLDFIPVRDDESGYLIQSLAPGTPLDVRIRDQGYFREDQVEAIALRTLEVLDYLSSLHPPVVHRDLKPANLLFDVDGTIHLVDFGAVQDAAERTISGGSTVAGTFGYMAPEQLHGVATPASDLYALGMTLVHLASGKHPSSLSRSGLHVQFRDEVDLRPRLVELIERLVEPDPNARFQSPAEALAFLRGQAPDDPTGDDVVCSECGWSNGTHYRYCVACGADLTDPAGDKTFGPSIESVLSKKEEAEAEMRRREIARRRAELQSRTNRVAVHTTDDEILLEVTPKASWLTPLSVAGFLFVNPGVFIVGGFPFLGQFWFPENWVLRLVIWTVFMLVSTALVVLRSRAPDRLRLSRNGHFMRYRRDANNPTDVGTFEDLTVSLFASDREVGVDSAELVLKDAEGSTVFSERFQDLSDADARMVNSVAEWEGFAEPRVTLFDPDANAASSNQEAPVGRHSWWR